MSAPAPARASELLAVLLLCAALLAQLWLGERALAPTFDELAHIPSGVARAALSREPDFTHPPLARDLAAVPLRLLGADPMDGPETRALLDGWRWKDYGRLFVFHNRALDPRTLVRMARLPNMLLTVLLGLCVWSWARRRAGAAGGLLSLAAFSFDPTVLAHGRLCTTDLPAALAFVLFAVVLRGRLERAAHDAGPLVRGSGERSWVETVLRESWPGVALGLALLVKFSALPLVPAALLLLVVGWRRQRALGRPVGFLGAVVRPATLAAVATLLTIWAGTGFELQRPADDPLLTGNPKAGKVVEELGGHLAQYGLTAADVLEARIPAYTFLKGLGTQIGHNFLQQRWIGHAGYQWLHGEYGWSGWWEYFPLTFLWKTPLPLLLGFGLALLGSLVALARRLGAAGSPSRALAAGELDPWVLAVPPLVYAAFCLTSTINIGHRYILPLYPFLHIALGGLVHLPAARTLLGRVALVGLVAALAATSLQAFPRHLSYFNDAVGGGREGWRYLVSSNVDWGQELYEARDHLAAAGVDAVYLEVNTSADPVADLGFRGAERLPPAGPDGAPPDVTGVAVLSVTELRMRAYADPAPRYAWLIDAAERPAGDTRPLGRIGDSLFCFYLDRGRVAAPPADSPAARLAARLSVPARAFAPAFAR